MATRRLLEQLSTMYQRVCGVDLQVESLGGVDAAKRVQSGEAFDVVFLASDSIGKLEEIGKVLQGSRVDLVRSSVAVAVAADSAMLEIGTAEALKRAVLAAATIGYSTGPSGTALIKLFERWGIIDRIRDRLVQATPGVPVASLVAEGKATLGFQQVSELVNVPGIRIVGPLPDAVQIVTIFSGAVCTTSNQREAVSELLRFLASPQTVDAKRREGMEPS